MSHTFDGRLTGAKWKGTRCSCSSNIPSQLEMILNTVLSSKCMERAEATKGKESRGRNEFWGGTVGSSRRKGKNSRVQILEQTSSSSILYEKYRPRGSAGATAIMSYQRVFEGGGVAHEVNRTKQRILRRYKARKSAAGEGERMWREEESIDGNVTCAEAPKTGRVFLSWNLVEIDQFITLSMKELELEPWDIPGSSSLWRLSRIVILSRHSVTRIKWE
ncbi:hypothetical protein B0H14DRAFT_2555257 [Mycena olivaceomarginata]|nr:hypothetical protein B0H14DRAFT_2555257 [Mycena olivaceomarginata]